MRSSKTFLVLLFLVFSIFISLPFLLDEQPIKQNDMNGNILQLVYLKDTIVNDNQFPFWNPYINQGLPFIADPLNSYLYPPTLLAFFMLSPEGAVRSLVLTSIFLSCITMYLLIRYFRVPISISAIIAMTYASSGFMASRIAAGHLEKILTYPLIPLFILFLLKNDQSPTIFKIGITAIILSLFFFAGDLYTTWYSLFILFGIFIYYTLTNPIKNLIPILILTFFIMFSAIKIFPMLELQDFISKTQDPFSGSMNIIGFVYYIFVPVKPLFALFNLDTQIPTGFGWWEKVSYIGPVPLIAVVIFSIKYRAIKEKNKIYLVAGILLLVMISTPAFVFNPYSIIIENIPNLSYFHVPSRTFAFLCAFFLLITSIVSFYLIKKYKAKKLILSFLTLNLISVTIFFYAIFFYRNFPDVNRGHLPLINRMSEDSSIFYVGYRHLSLPPQHVLLQNKMKALSPNHGLQLIDTPASKFVKFDYMGIEYTDITPKYFITRNKDEIPSTFRSQKIDEEGNMELFEIENFTPYATLSAGTVEKVSLHTNEISLDVDSRSTGTLQIIESFYPGWKAFRNGNEIELNNARFLSVNTIEGKHNYQFKFYPKSFIGGLIISLLSLLLWILLVIFQNKQNHRESFHKN